MPPAAGRNKREYTRISPATRADALQQLIQGHSIREVAISTGMSLGSVLNIRKECKENIPTPKRGRPNKISCGTKRLLARHFSIGQLKSLRDGQQFIRERDGVHVHVETVRQNLQQEGIRAYAQQKKPDLKPSHVRERYKFAREHIHWTVDDWSRVLFSDESMVSRVGSFGRRYYYSDSEHKRLAPHQVRPTQHGGGGRMMIWGCITFFGPGDLCRITGSLNSELYLEALQDYVLSTFTWYGMKPATSMFQHDNSPVHTATSVQDWLEEQQFTVLDWPANSPDLNIIEHVWRYIKYRLSGYETAPQNMNELWERVQDIWTSIPLDFLQGLYESMPRRMRDLLRNRGGNIGY